MIQILFNLIQKLVEGWDGDMDMLKFDISVNMLCIFKLTVVYFNLILKFGI